jgi:Tfp pilus assembly protein PilF
MSKRLLWVWMIGVWGLLVSPVANAEDNGPCGPDAKSWAAKVAAVQGKVEARRSNSDDWHAAKRHALYCPGDQIRVGKASRVSIILINETLIRLDEYSVITLTKIESDEPSLLDLLKGIAHFISRVPRSLKVQTPFVNAAIEGTEFVVAVGETDTTVTVFEGTVLAENNTGQQRLTHNESAIAKQGQAPEKILLAKPRDTVQWALYFPPVIKADAEGNTLQQASALLYRGRVEEATTLLKDLDNGEAKALQAIIAIVNNDTNSAFQLAGAAVQASPEAAAPYIAMSYALQASLDLDSAVKFANEATRKEADNAIAWARLAELQLSLGKLDAALASANKSTQLDSSIARAQTILGYAYLTQIEIEEARTTFNQAIELNQSDPLPHLGLGLAMIRKNELAEGRRQIEIAASLDPNNAIIRSYLGKAYYEEKRSPLDADQLAMAKELDPNDPTPYYYDAIRKQTENNPVGALEDINKSIELNNNRAVYRSSLQLDQDEAARSAGLAKVYQDLGFEQVAINEATNSLVIDPANHSAHRLLADAYSNRQRHEIAQASELFQSKMLQPLSLTFLQPQSIESDLEIISYANNFGNSSSDFTNLFNKNGTVASLNLFAGNHNTLGDELQVAGISDNFAISAAQYAYKSDGFRPNNDVDHDIVNLFMQSQLNNNLSIQAEFLDRETDKGDLDLLFNPNDFTDSERNTIDTQSSRIGFNYKATPEHTILGSLSYVDRMEQEQTTTTITFPIVITQITTIDDLITERFSELQDIYRIENLNVTTGIADINYNHDDIEYIRQIIPFVSDTTTITPRNFDAGYTSIYSYFNWLLTNNFELDFGASYEKYERLDQIVDRVNPKLGLKINFSENTSFRLASFSIINKPDITHQSLEPTQVTGFNQFYADLQGSKINQHNLAFDTSLSKDATFGISTSYRDIEAPIISAGSINFDELKEIRTQLYVNWIASRYFAISFTPLYESFENVNSMLLSTPKKLKTISYPLIISTFISNKTKLSLIPTYVNHDYVDASLNENHDSFVVTDLSIAYKLPNRRGNISLGVHNLFDENFNFYNLDYRGENNEPRFLPSRSFITKLNIKLP